MAATAQKRVKGADLYPPREIRDNTKARRAWIAAKIAELSADSSIESAKSVGIGSYQHVSVWNVVTVEGRERFRGVCQYCGASQVVDVSTDLIPRLVLHGYKRPGDGYLVGRCPGMYQAALNVDRTLTRRWLGEFTTALPSVTQAHAEATEAASVAETTLLASAENRYAADRERPRQPSKYDGADRVDAYTRALAAFREQYPVYCAWRSATEKAASADQVVRYTKMMIDHFTALLAGRVYGSPLEREVVP